MKSKLQPEIYYGILSGLGLSLWVLIEYALGFHNRYLEIGIYSGYISTIIPFIIVFLAFHNHQAVKNRKLSFIDGINIGFKIILVSSIILTVFFYFYNTKINPQWIELMVDLQKKKLILGGATDDEIGKFIAQNSIMNNPILQAIIGFIGSTTIGVMITLVEIPIVRKIFRATV